MPNVCLGHPCPCVQLTFNVHSNRSDKADVFVRLFPDLALPLGSMWTGHLEQGIDR